VVAAGHDNVDISKCDANPQHDSLLPRQSVQWLGMQWLLAERDCVCHQQPMRSDAVDSSEIEALPVSGCCLSNVKMVLSSIGASLFGCSSASLSVAVDPLAHRANARSRGTTRIAIRDRWLFCFESAREIAAGRPYDALIGRGVHGERLFFDDYETSAAVADCSGCMIAAER
jgi:hypothetical protein